MPKRNTFILCLGHQRCGTTWLHKHFVQSYHFAAGVLKEYHIWDALDLDLLNEHKLASLPDDETDPNHIRYQMQNDPNFYFDYFASLLSKEKNITADITPSYSSLSVDRIRDIRKNFASRNIKVKAVIILRDPLDRIKSATSFNLNRNNYREGIPSSVDSFEKALNCYYQSEHCEKRTNYHWSVENARKALGAKNVYVAIYESMFKNEKIDELSQFCGVYPFKAKKGRKVNQTKREQIETPEIDARIIERFQSTYDYCFKIFPETKNLWSVT